MCVELSTRPTGPAQPVDRSTDNHETERRVLVDDLAWPCWRGLRRGVHGGLRCGREISAWMTDSTKYFSQASLYITIAISGDESFNT